MWCGLHRCCCPSCSAGGQQCNDAGWPSQHHLHHPSCMLSVWLVIQEESKLHTLSTQTRMLILRQHLHHPPCIVFSSGFSHTWKKNSTTTPTTLIFLSLAHPCMLSIHRTTCFQHSTSGTMWAADMTCQPECMCCKLLQNKNQSP